MTPITTGTIARRHRIAKLRRLIEVARAELASLEGSERRVTALTHHRPTPPPAGPDAATVRAWAKATGLPIAPRGTIPTAITAAYTAAHREDPTA